VSSDTQYFGGSVVDDPRVSDSEANTEETREELGQAVYAQLLERMEPSRGRRLSKRCCEAGSEATLQTPTRASRIGGLLSVRN